MRTAILGLLVLSVKFTHAGLIDTKVSKDFDNRKFTYRDAYVSQKSC